jgi:hypothetical protein
MNHTRWNRSARIVITLLAACLLAAGCAHNKAERRKALIAEDRIGAAGACTPDERERYSRLVRHYKQRGENPLAALAQVRMADCDRVNGSCHRAREDYAVATQWHPDVIDARFGWSMCTAKNPVYGGPKPEEILKALDREEGIQPGRPKVTTLRAYVEEMVRIKNEKKAEKDRQLEARREEEERQRLSREKYQKEAKQRETRRRALLQKKVWKVGGVGCQVIDYQSIGDYIGNDIAGTEASGTFVGVLAKCTNLSRRSKQLIWTDFNLVDGAGNQFEVDHDGQYYHAVTSETGSHKMPTFIQLHPKVGSYIDLIFDIPVALANAPGLKLDFKGARYPLVFKELMGD